MKPYINIKHQQAQKLKAMPNVVVSKTKPLSNWTPLFTLGDKSQLKAAITHFAEFVGYKGLKDKKNNIILDPKGPIHRGDAFPPPVNKEGKYLGILWYELVTFALLFMNIEVMLKWAREHGKTFMATWFIEWSMIFCGKIGKDINGKIILDDQKKPIIVTENWLYFSSTKIMTKVGFWVYRWAKNKGYIIKASKGDKQNTYTSFELNNGAMMQIHKYMNEDVIGEHNWNFALDDIVKKSWKDRPSENQKAKDQWDILNYIGHVRVFIFGTRKFLGDPLEYLEEVHPDMKIDIRPPWVMEGVFPTWKPKIDPKTKREILIAPDLHTHEELYKKRDASRRAWMSEQMQDPQALGSKIWFKVNYINALETPYVRHYNLLFVYIDRATTTNLKSDLTGCVVGMREKKHEVEINKRKELVSRRIIIDDLTGKIPKEHLLYILSNYIHDYQTRYPWMEILLVIEKQGGGDDFYSDINTRSDFEFIETDEDGKPKYDKKGDLMSKRVDNYLRDANVIMVQSGGSKTARIEDRLETPIKNDQTGILFLSALRNSFVVKQILDYPNNDKVDG
jgi:hypothetical protein